ncbi:MAG: MscS Mechanosensitive ion channel [uncultured Thermomicrobiales bacterium]|uniref:MscS Mechanosensitive ion channel n=1 Tax=uncultured Thermomicrobiales bacterium TaxID=1645740 RepID=A0A6J4U2E6_9BACT|nr:MAG: MscS Mechanosensitive ion channel [uncultured Thermomicrobiales bacterium]
MEIVGIRLVGVNAETGQKLLLTVVFFVTIVLLRRGLSAAAFRLRRVSASEAARFWTRQVINIATTLLLVLGLLSLWFDDPARLATALGLVTAGLAFALQRVVTSVAGYFVILRGNNFTVGDRITMGGVLGDVIGLGFIQTTIMEMGQPPAVQGADPAVWVRSRQYTGRVVSVSNAKIFDEPVYNYTRDFPYIWEELTLLIGYRADRDRSERILLTAAERHTAPIREESQRALEAMQRHYAVQASSVEPRVYYRLTDNWLELTLRFVAEERGVRDLKDAMCRDILRDLDAAGIEIASATVEIVGIPTLRMENGRGTVGG